ncbi:MAG: hypothetical protein BKP49_07630 [Treponema sp. CETP13]|nr:MAG: hypothetical protein BKP49_07630 [Treponema sp. CETP13]
MKKHSIQLLGVVVCISVTTFWFASGSVESDSTSSKESNYAIVDTNQGLCYNNKEQIDGPAKGEAFYGQDAQYTGNVPSYTDNGDGTVTDNVTGLTWTQELSDASMVWEDADDYCDSLTTGGYDDWRLPNIKELQSIVDYSGSFPAIDTSVFNITEIVNEAGNKDYPYFWSSTSNPYIDKHDDPAEGYCYAWYVAFGYAVDHDGEDMHGAGAVRFDTKTEAGAEGIDGERVNNYVRLVRGGNVIETPEGDPSTVDEDRVVVFEDGDTGMPAGNKGPRKEGDVPQNGHEDSQGLLPQDGQMQGGQPGGRPDFAAAAEKLGITEDELVAALGISEDSMPPERQ